MARPAAKRREKEMMRPVRSQSYMKHQTSDQEAADSRSLLVLVSSDSGNKLEH